MNNVYCVDNIVHAWHNRLGQHNNCILQIVLKHCKFLLPNKVDSPLELLFTYLWGPAHFTSFAGYKYYKYYVSFIDAYSRYTWIFPIKSKGDTMSIFQNFKQFVRLQLGLKIKIFNLIWVESTNHSLSF